MTDARIRIASYNIRKARGLDQRRDPARSLRVINGLGADIVLLQEADKRLGPRKPAISREMIAQETDLHLVEVSTNGISLGWHGNAVLVRDPAMVQGITRIDLPGFEPRGAVRVELGFGDGLTVTGTHLGLRRKDRQAQLDVLAGAGPNGHNVLAGDFNEWSDRKGLDPLAYLYNVYAPGRTFHARRPVASLDRIALSLGVRLHDAGVDQSKLARQASDHLPIWSDIAVSQPAVTCRT